MAAPATMGKYCTKLADMEIGDYIKCVYEAPYSNDAGYFSQLGTKDPYYIKTTTTTTDGVKGDPVVEKVKYAELPTTPLVNNISGYFYLLKADYGMLIADRMVQQQISWETLNKKNYIYGGAFDAVNARTTQTVDITITHKTFESTDTASDATTTDNQFDSADRYVETKRTQVVVGNAYVAATDTAAEVPAKPTTTTVTVTRTNYAFLDYTPKDTIVSVDPAEPFSVDFGKTADDVAAILAPITTAKATILSKEDEKTTFTKDINVTWDTAAFKVNTIGRQTIYGTLEDLSTDPENPIMNPDEIKASVIITTKADQITSVAAVKPVTVKYGTTKSNLATTLESIPMVDLTISKEDGTTYEKKGVTVVWDTSKYTTRIVGQQTIYGVLEDLSELGIANDNEVKAEVIVNTAKIGTIDSYGIKTVTTENGSSNIADLLGSDITANITTDYYNPDENVSTLALHVSWDTTTIDTTIPGDQTVNGTITDDISDYEVKSPRPTATVTIKSRIDSYEELAFTVENGTTVEDVAKQLKSTITGNTTTPDGTSTLDLAVTWDTSSYNAAKPGVQSINGTITTDISNYTNKAGVPAYKVTVKPTIDSYLTPTLTVNTGTTVEDLTSKLATTVTANTTTSTGTSTVSLAVTWDTSSFDSSTAGDKVISGNVTDDISTFTNKAGNPTYNITVTEPATTE